MSEHSSTRFDALDGLRGIAAFAVVIYHYTQHNGLHWLGGAWVAVDLFFVLSGFVIAHSYGAKIMNGMTLKEFAVVRLVRLGPLYFIALALGLLAALLSVRLDISNGATPSDALTAFALGLAWLPYFNLLAWPFGVSNTFGPVFPLNEPSWSLFFEMFVGFAYFGFVCRWRRYSSAALVLVVAGLYVIIGRHL